MRKAVGPRKKGTMSSVASRPATNSRRLHSAQQRRRPRPPRRRRVPATGFSDAAACITAVLANVFRVFYPLAGRRIHQDHDVALAVEGVESADLAGRGSCGKEANKDMQHLVPNTALNLEGLRRRCSLCRLLGNGPRQGS
ncbi:hypothetical protein ACP70R_046004 [Stipagrostis hirtigluma subsp. patula]